MTDAKRSGSAGAPQKERTGRLKRVAVAMALLVIAYLVTAYVILPAAWDRYAHHHPSFDDNPRLTKTSDGHPGDPLNMALIGTEKQVNEAFQAAKWFAADSLGVKSDLEIAEATVLKRSYDKAPVSKLYLFGRSEDLAFEKPVGKDPRKRNHVRFWRTEKVDTDGRTIWIGSASYDERVGVSHTTGQITHHIAPDVDTERDRVLTDLQQANCLKDRYEVPGYHTVLEGKNGGGDRWYTDGALGVGVIATDR